MKLSIIIVAYNNGNELLDCLNSIFQNNDLGESLEVIVVDNSPNDRVERNLEGYEGIIYIKNPDNGFGRGNNIGYQNSTGEYLLFLNPDALIISPCFQRIITLYSANNDYGMAGMKLLDAEGNENNSYNIRLNYGIMKKIILKLSRKFDVFIPSLMYTCGADIFTDRETFSKIGCFDEKIFMYGEEQDIAFRLDGIGKKIAYFSTVKIIHLQGKSSGKNVLINRQRMTQSSKYICEKYNKPFKRMVESEVRYLKLSNTIRKVLRIAPKYDSEIIAYYESLIEGELV